MHAENGDFGMGVFKRPSPKPAPALAEMGEKKPTENGWFLECW